MNISEVIWIPSFARTTVITNNFYRNFLSDFVPLLIWTFNPSYLAVGYIMVDLLLTIGIRIVNSNSSSVLF